MIYELQGLWILWCDHPGMYNYFPYYSDVIMSAIASQITGVSVVCSNVYSGRCRSKKTSKIRVTGLCEGNPSVTGGFPHKRPVTRKIILCDDVIMLMPNDSIELKVPSLHNAKSSINIILWRQGPLLSIWINIILGKYIHYKVWIEFLIHSQTSIV